MASRGRASAALTNATALSTASAQLLHAVRMMRGGAGCQVGRPPFASRQCNVSVKQPLRLASGRVQYAIRSRASTWSAVAASPSVCTASASTSMPSCTQTGDNPPKMRLAQNVLRIPVSALKRIVAAFHEPQQPRTLRESCSNKHTLQ
jgi:hypothetical protein